MRNSAVVVFFLLFGHVLHEPAHSLEPGETIVVELEGGRRATGEFAGLDKGQHLWLIRREAGIELRSGYGWNRIQRVLVQGKPISPAAFQEEKTSPASPWKIPLQTPPPTPARNPPPRFARSPRRDSRSLRGTGQLGRGCGNRRLAFVSHAARCFPPARSRERAIECDAGIGNRAAGATFSLR